MITILNIILAILSLPIGLWWFYRMRQEKTLSLLCNIEYLLLVIFGAYNSLACMVSSKLDTPILYVIVDLIGDFFSLLIMPIIYHIIADITKNNVSRRRLCVIFITALLVGVLNVVLQIISIFYCDVIFVNTYFFNVVLFLQLLILGYAMLRTFYIYRKRVFCYYVDIQTTDFNKAHDIVRCFFFVIIISYLQLLFQRGSFDGNDEILLMFNLSVAIIICVVGWNMSCMSGDTVVLDVTSKPYTPAEVLEMTKKIGTEFTEKKLTNDEPSEDDIPSSQAIEDIIKRWAQRPYKPYLREGISLTMAAEDMGLSVRIVSFYLNNVLKVNFNAWINSLRIEEAIRLLNKRTALPVSVIAVKCGFADTSMLSKNFKRIVGMTITEYRRKNNLV